jgi:hypothetical protein
MILARILGIAHSIIMLMLRINRLPRMAITVLVTMDSPIGNAKQRRR